MRWGLAVLAAACIVAGSPASAEESLWQVHPHHVSVVIAGSDDDEDTAFTLGLDYEYRWNELLGIGFVIEYAFEDIDATTLLGVVDVHIWRGLAVQTGPGVEFVDGEEEFTYRLGVLYEFEFDRVTLSPQVHYDFTTGENSVVFGLALGYCF